MFSRLRTRLRKKLDILKEDNKGAAIVVAIVAIAFIGMLVGMLVYMAYYNYLMKHIDKRNKDNFYSAEYALDIINAGLQKDISDSMTFEGSAGGVINAGDSPPFLYIRISLTPTLMDSAPDS